MMECLASTYERRQRLFIRRPDSSGNCQAIRRHYESETIHAIKPLLQIMKLELNDGRENRGGCYQSQKTMPLKFQLVITRPLQNRLLDIWG